MGNDHYTVTTPPNETPVSLEEAKDWCRVSTTADDTLITSLIDAAVDVAERYTNRVFIERTFVGKFIGLEWSRFEINRFLQVRRAPFKSLTSITDSDTNDLTSDFILKENSAFSRLILDDSISLDTVPYPLIVEFVAGYGAKADVPEGLKTAIKQLVCFMYSNKGDCGGDTCTNGKTSGIPQGIATMLNGYKILNTFG